MSKKWRFWFDFVGILGQERLILLILVSEESRIVVVLSHVNGRWLVGAHVCHCLSGLLSLILSCLFLLLLCLSFLQNFQLVLLVDIPVIDKRVCKIVHKSSTCDVPFDVSLENWHLEKLMNCWPFGWILLE